MHQRFGSARREKWPLTGPVINSPWVELPLFGSFFFTLTISGLGIPQVAERVEKRMVAREEGDNIVNTGTAVTQDWDAAWDGDEDPVEESVNGRNRRSIEEERQMSGISSKLNCRLMSSG